MNAYNYKVQTQQNDPVYNYRYQRKTENKTGIYKLFKTSDDIDT